MKTRSIVALATLALALGAFIVFYERHTVGTSEVEQRKGRLLDVFDRANVRTIEIEYDGRAIVLTRENENEEFALARPIEAPADDSAVEALLGALDWAVPFRTLEGVSTEDRARFGLDEPFARVTLQVGDRPVRLVVGKEAPGGEGRYAAARLPDKAFVISADVLEALSHDVNHFRSKELFPGGFVKVARIARKGEGGDFALVESEGALRLETPISMHANRNRVEAMIKALEELRAARFLDERDVEPALLATPRARIDVRADGDDRALEIFGGCPEADGKALARVSGGPLVCVDEASLDAIVVPAGELRETRLATARDFDVERLELRFGERRLVVDLGDEPRFELHEAGKRVREGEADESAFTEWLRSMRRTEAREVTPLSERDRARYGLREPLGELRIVERGPMKRTSALHLGNATVTALYARREGDDVLLKFPADAADLLRPAVFRVKSRALIDAELHQVVSVHVTPRGGERAEIGPSARSELVARLASLEAVRFDADAPEPRHGLDDPRVVLEIELSPESDHGHDHGPQESEHTRHRLVLGASTDDGVFARLDDDPAVFVVAQALLDASS